MLEAVLLEESAGEPTDQEILLYAESIGIDVEKERDLLYIAEEGISANLPKGWQVLKDENNQIFYYDSKSGISIWEHPLDEYFRNCVIKARQKNQRGANTVKHSKHDDESSESCVSPANNIHPPSKQDMVNKQTPKGFTTNTDPNKDSRSHSLGDCKPSEKNKDVNQEDKNKLPMNNTPGCQDLTTKRKDEVLSTDDPTEYRDFKLPGSKRRDKSLTLSTPNNNNNNKPQFFSPASRRSSSKNFKIWSEIYAENLRKADNNLTALQDKVRKSLLTDNDKLITPEVINDSAPTKYKCNSRRQLQDSPVKIGKSFSSLDLLNNTDKKADRIFYEKYGVLSSDVKKFKDYCDDDEDILCPEVGLSPTEIKDHLTTGDQRNVESPVMNCKTNSSIPSASNVGHHTEVNVKNATKSNYESQSPNQNISKPNNNKGFVNLSECISHLIEERSRIQGKLFRLKLLYKTYKRRLDNLDSSLLALQKQTNIDPSDDGLSPSKTGKPSYRNSNDCADKANNTSISHQSPTADKQLPVTPQIPMTKKVVVVTKSLTNQKREDKSTQSPAALSSSLSPASLSHCHHHHQHQHSNIWQTTRRSMSVPRSPLPLNHCRSSTSTAAAAATANHFLHDSISKTSQDLAVSLASIDLQLHHVLNHLDSSITPNHQLPVKNYSCSECQCCCCCSVSARNDNATEQSPCLHEDEENIQQIEQHLENIDLNDTTPLLLGGCTSSNLSCLPSCSCWKSQCKSQSSNRTMELFSSPTNRLLNSCSVGVDYNELESVRASLGSLLKSARKPKNTSYTQTPFKNNNNKDRNDNHNSDSPYKCK